MADLVSPGILVKETDLTNVVPPVGGASGAIVIAAEKGPAEQAVTITSESDLVEIFGKPLKGASTDWLVASQYLSYAGNLQVARGIGGDTLNASDGDASSPTATIIDAGTDSGGTDWGSIGANTITKVGISNLAAPTVSPGIGYSVNDGVITGVEIDTATFTGAAVGTYYVHVSGGNNDAIVAITASANTADSIVLIYGGTGYPEAGGAEQDIILPTNVASADAATLSATLAGSGNPLDSVTSISSLPTGTNEGDYFVIPQTSLVNSAVITVSNVSGGTLVKNTTDWTTKVEGGYTANSFVAKDPGKLGNNLKVGIIGSGGDLDNFVDGTIDLGQNFDYDPVKTDFATDRGGNHDEVHVIVYDSLGGISGKKGTILEKFSGISLATDAKDSFGASNYIVDVLYNKSQYVYFTGDWTSISTGTASNWESKTADTDFTTAATGLGAAFKLVQLGGGVDDAPTAAERASLYTDLWNDKETTEVSFLIGGAGATVSASQTAENDIVASTLKGIVDIRKDCIAFISPPKSTRGKDLTSSAVTVSDKAIAVSAYQTNNSSYVIVDSGWKKVYNRYTDNYEAVPLCGDTAGITAQTEQTNDAWWSPAGYNRGNVRNVYELYFNPDQAARDKLYKAGVNPVVSFPGQGVVLFGDKTSQSKPSAFDRINVRRLFIHVEKAISTAAKSFMFEFNDEFTRAQFRNMVEPFLRDIQGRRGIYDFQVVCDSSNNTSQVVDRNEFVGDIYIKPARSINFIRLNFVAVRSGVEFSEIAG
tara:strand:+ start:1474 stop:3765 length:2292 start_codon:yes stop_codon:yes gene_type:complete